jgi:FkbM family methyltransferase
MEYAVPVMKNGQGDFVGILPDAEGQPGTDFYYLSINVSGTNADGTARRENAGRKMNVDVLKLSQSCQLPLLLHFYAKYLSQTGIFVEVGAYDGESFSNSSCLADAGWTGYYIEPIPEFAQKCKVRHSKNSVKVFNLAISDKDELVDLNLSGPLTTASTDTLSAYKEITWSKEKAFDKRHTVQATTLDNFLNSNEIQRNFDLLIVDVEGFEGKVFDGFNMAYWSPKMMIVELNDYHSDFISTPDLQLSSKRIRERIIGSGYMQVYADAINTIFVHDSMRLNH